MNPKTVKKLEKELTKAIADVVVLRLGLGILPLLPSHGTFEKMAKAAAEVYVEVVDNKQKEGWGL
jgi:hypothetical protein